MDKRQEKLIAELYGKMHNRLFYYAKATLKNEPISEEIVQETFLIACMNPDKLLKSENPEGWLVNTLKNTMQNEVRSRARMGKLIMESEFREGQTDIEPGTYDDYTGIEYSDILSKDDFSMLKMYVFEKRSMLEIAQMFGLSVSAVKKRVQRARDRLRNNEKSLEEI